MSTVERQLGLRVLVQREVRLGQADAQEPLAAPLEPLLVAGEPVRVGMDEVLHFHLLELARAEDEVPRRDLVAERLPDLRDAERQLHAAGVDHVAEVDEHALRRLGPQVGDRRRVAHRADVRLEHHVERPGLGEAARFARRGGRDKRDLLGFSLGEIARLHGRERTLDGLLALERLGGLLEGLRRALAFERADVTHRAAVDDDGREEQLVGAEALLAHLAVHQRVGEAGDVTRGLPHLRVHDDGRLEPHDVFAAPHHVVPPAVADVPLQLHAQRAVVEEAVEPAVDLRRLEDEAAALRERDDGVHGHGGGCGIG